MNCLICKKKPTIVGSLEQNEFGYSKNAILKHCIDCNLSWTSPLPDEKKLASIYSKKYHYNSGRLFDKFIGFLNIPTLLFDYYYMVNQISGGNVLDIGAGRGDLLKIFSNRHWNKHAFDPFISKDDSIKLSERSGATVNEYLRLENYPKETFDLIIIRNIIEHSANFIGLLDKIVPILKKGGLIFIRTPNIDSYDYKIFKNDWYVVNMYGHIVFFSKKSILKLASRHELFVLKFNTDFMSAPLSYFRSKRLKINITNLIHSMTHVLRSLLNGGGGDMILLLKK